MTPVTALLEARRESCIDGPLAEVMTCGPTAVETGTRLVVACQLLADRKISELPVINALGQPVGLIDITDVWNVPVAATSSEPVEEVDRTKILKLHAPHLEAGGVRWESEEVVPSFKPNVENCRD